MLLLTFSYLEPLTQYHNIAVFPDIFAVAAKPIAVGLPADLC